MTRRDRLQAKLDRRQEWAEKAQARSDQRFGAADRIADAIPFGQPILRGHHSERHARRDQERIQNNMQAGVEEYKLAQHHSGKAVGLTHQLDRSIFSDDDNAIDALRARIAEREATAARYVERNKAWRKSKGDPVAFAQLVGITEVQAQAIAKRIAEAYSWEKQPHAAWELSNLRANIRRDQERIAQIEQQAERTAQADTDGGVTVAHLSLGYCRVTFAEKPDRTILDSLKTAGFRWGAGSWLGKSENLPNGIEEPTR